MITRFSAAVRCAHTKGLDLVKLSDAMVSRSENALIMTNGLRRATGSSRRQLAMATQAHGLVLL